MIIGLEYFAAINYTHRGRPTNICQFFRLRGIGEPGRAN